MSLLERFARREAKGTTGLSLALAEPLGHVFVVTYGRSGSTLLQGLLNTLPGTLVRGENEFFIRGLYQGHLALTETQKRWSGPAALKGAASAFYGADVIDLHTFEGDIRRSVNSQLLGSTDPQGVRWLGFKEVLWHQVTPEETGTFLEFMDVIFPNARYVLHRRNHENVLASGFWKKWDEDKARAAILRVEEFQDELAEGRRDRICWTSYEDLTSADEKESRLVLERLAQCMEYDPTDKLLVQLRETLSIGHGPHPSTGVMPVPVAAARKGRKAAASSGAKSERPKRAETQGFKPSVVPWNKKQGQKLKRRAVNRQNSPVLRRPPAHDGPPRVAVMTMVHNEVRMLPRWVDYYGKHFGVENLLVLDDNSNDNSTKGLSCPVIQLPEHPWKRGWGVTRVGLANRIADGFLACYDVVIFTDVDEFLVPDPAKYSGLVDYLAANPDPDVVAPLAFNVLHNPSVEPELDETIPTLQQRTFVKFAPGMCKPLVKRASLNWSTAFHGIAAPFSIDPDLLLLHLKFFDLPSLAAVADHRHQVHVKDDRGNKLSAWALDSDELTSRMLTWVTLPEGQQVPDLEPAAVDFSRVVRLSKKGVYRAFGPQLDEMDKNPLMRLPERYRSAF